MINRAEQNWPEESGICRTTGKLCPCPNHWIDKTETLLERTDRVISRVEALNLIETLYNGRKRECDYRWMYKIDSRDCQLAVRILRHAWQYLSAESIPKLEGKIR